MFSNKVFLWNAVFFAVVSLTGLVYGWVSLLVALSAVCAVNLLGGLLIVFYDKKIGGTMLIIGGVIFLIGFSLCSGMIKI
jgi:hypothetical protein